MTGLVLTVDSVSASVGDLRGDFEQFVLNDSLEHLDDLEFQKKIECAVDMIVEGETPGYNDCPPRKEGESQ